MRSLARSLAANDAQPPISLSLNLERGRSGTRGQARRRPLRAAIRGRHCHSFVHTNP